MRIVPEELGHSRLSHITLRNIPNQPFKLNVAQIKFYSAQRQKHDRGHCAGPSVPVEEGMILHDVEKIRGRRLVQIAVKILPAKRCCRHRRSRLQQSELEQTCGTSVAFYLVAMNLQDFGQAKK